MAVPESSEGSIHEKRRQVELGAKAVDARAKFGDVNSLNRSPADHERIVRERRQSAAVEGMTALGRYQK